MHTVNQNKHVKNGEFGIAAPCPRRTVVDRLVLCEKELECVADGDVPAETEVGLCKWMFRVEERIFARKIALHLSRCQATRVVLIERKGAIEERNDVDGAVFISLDSEQKYSKI